ncbi:MAG: rhodanese-like domain-containing protein [Salinigranum sp.]
MSTLDPAALDDRLGDDDLFVLDVRPREVYRTGHIEGSFNAPVYGDLRSGDVDALESYLDDVPRDAEVVTVCKAGIVARRATSHLRERGYAATTLAGGMRGWRGYRNGSLGYRLFSLLRRVVSR